jgi:membrane-bound ClpP family serine protease
MLAPLASVFAGLALMFLLFELKTPGVGLWAGLSMICGFLFLLSQYYLDMVNYIDIALIVLGLVLLITEFLTVVGGGLLGIAGAALILGGLTLSFLPNDFEVPRRCWPAWARPSGHCWTASPPTTRSAPTRRRSVWARTRATPSACSSPATAS